MTNEKSTQAQNIERTRFILTVACALLSHATAKADNPFSVEKRPNGFKIEFNPVKLFKEGQTRTNIVAMLPVTNNHGTVASAAPAPSGVVSPSSSAPPPPSVVAAAVTPAERVGAAKVSKGLTCGGTGKCQTCGGSGQVQNASNTNRNDAIAAEAKKRQPIPEQRIGAELSEALKQEILSSIQQKFNEVWEQREGSWFCELRAAINASCASTQGLKHQLVERKSITWVVSRVMDPGDLGRLNGEAWKVQVQSRPSYMRIKSDDQPWGLWESAAAFRRIVATCVNGELVYTLFGQPTHQGASFPRHSEMAGNQSSVNAQYVAP